MRAKLVELVSNVGQMFVEVTKPYQAQYSDPITFAGGELVEVGKADPEFPEWFWCRARSGKEGWVHRSFLTNSTSPTTATRDYSARELNVTGGERGTALESFDGWVRLRLESGVEGWLPQGHVRIKVG